MNWADIRTKPTPAMLRQFAAAWLVMLSAWGLYLWFGRDREAMGIVSVVLAVGVGSLGLIKPSSVTGLFSFLMILAFPIGWLVSHLMLMLMFYGIITPVAFILKLTGRDVLGRKPAPNRTSFWTPKPIPPDVRRYFRQY